VITSALSINAKDGVTCNALRDSWPVLRYTGDFVADKFEGLGICEFLNSSIFHGEYKAGRNASGEKRAIFAGLFLSLYGYFTIIVGKQHGDGVFCYCDGSKYTGAWFDDQVK
jgi:hypothetical protein